MTISTRGIAAFKLLLVTLLFAFAGAALAQPASKSFKDQLVGHWQLVSVGVNDSSQAYGDNPQGSMFADAAGHYAVIVLSTGGARSIALFGTYTVDDADSSVTLHVDGSNLTDVVGQDVKRFVSLKGDELTATNQRNGAPIGLVTMVWKRAN